ncbi:MAG: hypothetical protein K6F25_04735 [Bacteroidales bacterium]|nr:hypothetical protein [Bacteroidales bacterium]
MEKKISYSTEIPCFMADRHKLLRPVSFFDLAQQMAMVGGEYCGFGEEVLAKFGLVWVLARMDVKFLKPIRRDDRVTINTWHRGQESIFFIREYEMLDESGERAAVSTSSWILMNFETRRAVRADRIEGFEIGEAQNDEHVMEEDARKVVVPRDAVLQKVDGHRVAYSDIDVNQHVNNARYIVWAMDAIPEEVVNDRPVSEVSINFIKEALPGEVVDLYHVEAEGVHYVEGKVADSVIFTTRFVF